jgi:hypothetical protein
MPQRSRYNFWIDKKLKEGLQSIYDRDGILPSEQIRRAIKDWLVKKGLELDVRHGKSKTAKASK